MTPTQGFGYPFEDSMSMIKFQNSITAKKLEIERPKRAGSFVVKINGPPDPGDRKGSRIQRNGTQN